MMIDSREVVKALVKSMAMFDMNLAAAGNNFKKRSERKNAKFR